MKKLAVIIFSILIFLFILNKYSHSIITKLNWGIALPNASHIEEIFRFDFREGEDMEIWTLNNNSMKRIKNNELFSKITNLNKASVHSKLQGFYNTLDDEERKKFDENLILDDIVINDNYYAYLSERNSIGQISYLLLILDIETNSLYYLNCIG